MTRIREGSFGVSRSYQNRQERGQQRLASATNIMHELKEGQIRWQLFLREAPMGAKPRAQQGPEAFQRVDMDLMKPIAIFVTGVFTR